MSFGLKIINTDMFVSITVNITVSKWNGCPLTDFGNLQIQ
jgi:hypothetical protein